MSDRHRARRSVLRDSRRSLYRRGKHLLLDLLDGSGSAPRAERERAVRRFLRDRPRP